MKLLTLFSSLTFLCMAMPIFAGPVADFVARLPQRVFEPPTGAGKAFNADARLPPNYVEQEFLVSGNANIYGHDGDRNLIVNERDRAYTTRILVRYPRDAKAFSGNVMLDLLHPEAGMETLWPNIRDYVAASGDAYAQVTTTREPFNPLLQPPRTAITRVRMSDPVRYAQIDMPDSGLNWDVISQVGLLLRSDVPENPLRAYLPKKLFAGGFSGGGAVTLFYVNEISMRTRMPDGAPVFDGYLVGEPSTYLRANSKADAADELPDSDPRQQVQPRDVPVIQMFSMGYASDFNGKGRYRADSDAADDRFRLWVVGGAHHGGRHAAAMMAQLGQPMKCQYPASTVPLDHYFVLAFHHLKRWSRGEGVPPHAKQFALDADGKVAWDVNGNPTGGVRSVPMELPTASHPENGPGYMCQFTGGQVAFSPEKLKQLYGTREAYLARVDALTQELIKEGWLLPEQMTDVINDARKVDFGQAALASP